MKKKKTKGRDEFDRLAYAVADYLKSMGGSAVVVGGIQVEREIGAPKFRYALKIGITGKLPLVFIKTTLSSKIYKTPKVARR